MNQKLLDLEKTGNYVFHGSSRGDIEFLEPRQARYVPDMSKPTESALDGEPAVCATPHAEFAIFKAIINRENVPFAHRSGFGFHEDEKYFGVSSKEVLAAVTGKKGFVYVLDRNSFKPYSRTGQATERSMEWRSYGEIKPMEVIEVSSDDLPPENEIEIAG
jgi:hypothetical protein